ncbi:MAG: DUF2238 domain-containing protein [bacterium]
MSTKQTIDPLHLWYLGSFFAILIWSVINPKDLFTWFLEVIPAIIGVTILVLTYNRFRFTNLVYMLILIHTIILMIGGHYTYAEMPLFNWFKEIFDLSRNHYDRLGHLAQGFIPAMIAREVLLRTTGFQRGKMFVFVIICICLAISAFYEFIEWWVALSTGEKADAFLATQGDIWDTQWDMFFAFCGACLALMTLSKVHDAALKNIE